ncbi:MAG: hypothetical protein AB7J40_05750 [Candidatus Altimarinota bacterium]
MPVHEFSRDGGGQEERSARDKHREQDQGNPGEAVAVSPLGKAKEDKSSDEGKDDPADPEPRNHFSNKAEFTAGPTRSNPPFSLDELSQLGTGEDGCDADGQDH